MSTTYGFSGAVNNSQNRNNTTGKTGFSIEGHRVKDIILGPESKGYEEYGGDAAIGYIFFEKINGGSTNREIYSNPAIPLFPNLKFFPLIGEIVPIINLPQSLTSTQRTGVKVPYYLPPVNIWNNPHVNPSPYVNPTIESQNKSLDEIQAGFAKKVNPNLPELKLGNTFKEKDNIRPLQPFEGDHIIEGRWGNSIRLSSTIKDSTNCAKNEWSKIGTNGDPIIILRNGQPNLPPASLSTSSSITPITEEVDKDKSSIYLTSTQQIPLKNTLSDYSSYTSYIPKAPGEYTGNQIMLNSGRIMLNANSDHIVMSSKLTTSFNAGKGFNFDSGTNFVVKTKTTIRLGDKMAPHPLLKGDVTIKILTDFLKNLKIFLNTLQSSTDPGLVAMVGTLPFFLQNIEDTIVDLDTKTKSSKTYTK
jgi:hypothetical protein